MELETTSPELHYCCCLVSKSFVGFIKTLQDANAPFIFWDVHCAVVAPYYDLRRFFRWLLMFELQRCLLASKREREHRTSLKLCISSQCLHSMMSAEWCPKTDWSWRNNYSIHEHGSKLPSLGVSILLWFDDPDGKKWLNCKTIKTLYIYVCQCVVFINFLPF